MSKKIENIDTAEKVSSPFEAIRKELPHAPVFAFLERFDKFLQKKQKILKREEVLFEPGENPYFYIVTSGALSIFRINPSLERKEVGKVYTGAFIGEGVISNRNQKDVLAESITDRTIVTILTKEDLEFLESQDPATLAKLYKHINNITSLRLSDTSKELALMYETTGKFQEFQELGERGLLASIKYIRDMLGLESVLMIEEHPFVPGLFMYKYNTKFPSVWPMNQKVEPGVVLKPGYSDSEFLSFSREQILFVEPLPVGEETLGYLVIARKKDEFLTDGDLRILEHTAPMVAHMLLEVQHKKNEKAMLLKERI